MQFNQIKKLNKILGIVNFHWSIRLRQNHGLPSLCDDVSSPSHSRETERATNAFDVVSEDLSDVVPYFPPTFNLASYVNRSETLQKLLQLQVNLSKIEKKPHVVVKILKLDFERDIKQQLMFMKEFVELEEIGPYITKNPLILCEPLEDLEVRVNYLKSKSFSHEQIKRIVSKNPYWLMFSTLRIDRRLGHFQEKFSLCGNEVRLLSTLKPKIITYNMHHINTNTFTLKEEMGFEDNELKQLILNKPSVFMLNQRALLERFNYLHNVIQIPHSVILQNPGVLMSRNFRVKQRHMFLKKLGRDQYSPKKENFVPIMALVEGTDSEFCKKYAKCTVDDFNLFLKTM